MHGATIKIRQILLYRNRWFVAMLKSASIDSFPKHFVKLTSPYNYTIQTKEMHIAQINILSFLCFVERASLYNFANKSN